jgi:hypothetical protein
MPVSYEDLVAVAKARVGQSLTTIGGRATFTTQEVRNQMYIVPDSTKRPRPLQAGAQEALKIYNETGSMTTSDYQQATVNSSYLLRLFALASGRS